MDHIIVLHDGFVSEVTESVKDVFSIVAFLSVFVLKNCLHILFQEGTYAELLKNSGAFADFLQTYSSEENSGLCCLSVHMFCITFKWLCLLTLYKKLQQWIHTLCDVTQFSSSDRSSK